MNKLDEKLQVIIDNYAISSSVNTDEAITAIKKVFEEELPEKSNKWQLSLEEEGYERCLSEIKQKLWGGVRNLKAGEE